MRGFRISWFLLATVHAVLGQNTATLRGIVTDPAGAGVEEARVSIESALTGFRKETVTRSGGAFVLSSLPFQDYALTVEKEGFSLESRGLSLHTNVPLSIDIQMKIADVVESVSVSATAAPDLVDPEMTGTRTMMSESTIDRMPLPPGNRGIESALVSFPGFAANANGAIHPRGAHNQMTYVVDGMPISDQLTGAFATSIDSNIAQTVELFTGNVPAEFGSKISGVAAITTRSGLGSGRKFSGNTTITAAQFDTIGQVTQFSGESGRSGYFASVNTGKSNRYLDQVSIDNLHNGGNSERAYGKIDYQATSHDWLRFHGMAGRSSLQIANLRSQHANLQDQRQEFRDYSGWIGYVRTVSPFATVDSTLSFRKSIAQFTPSPGDTPVTAAQDRQLTTLNWATRYNHIEHSHNLRAGFDLQHFPVREQFDFAITDPGFNDPASPSYNPALAAYDLTRGGSPYRFANKEAGQLYSVFGQDNARLGRWMLSLGIRYDNYRFLTIGNQVQPRVGIAYHIRETGTVLRASYNRNYQTPPNENLLLSNSGGAATLVLPEVREAQGGAFLLIRPQRENVYELGFQQMLGKKASLNAAYYHKDSTDLQDNDNFFNTGIIFPTSLAKAQVNGVEGRLVVPEYRGFSGSLSGTHYHAVVTPPFTGGLFIGSTAMDLLGSGPFVIDHDQVLGMHGLVEYRNRRGVWTSWSVRYDSGLVSNPSDPAKVAQDPDYADLLPYVNLESNPPRVNPRTIIDFSLGYERRSQDRRRWEVVFQVTNLTDRTALYNFQSIFVGTRLVQPRTAGVKLRFYF